VVSTLCCAGPLVAVALGLSGAGLAASFEPLTAVLRRGHRAGARLRLRRAASEEKRACVPGTLCASPIARRRMKWGALDATIVSIPLLTFPWWSKLVLG